MRTGTVLVRKLVLEYGYEYRYRYYNTGISRKYIFSVRNTWVYSVHCSPKQKEAPSGCDNPRQYSGSIKVFNMNRGVQLLDGGKLWYRGLGNNKV